MDDSGAITAIAAAIGKHPHPGLERRVSQVELKELGQHEQRPDEGEHGQAEGGDRRPRSSARGRTAGSAWGATLARSHATKPARTASPATPAPITSARRPAVDRRLDDGPTAAVPGRRPTAAPPPGRAVGQLVSLGLGQDQHGGRQTAGGDGHVDEEHRAPPEVGQQPAPGHRADGDAQPGSSPTRCRWPWPCSAGRRKTSVRIERVAGMMAAAPMPITARAATNQVTEPEKADAAEPAPKTASPAALRLRP